MSNPMLRFSSNALHAFTQAVFASHGLSEAHAHHVADNLVDANLRGLDTHGVARIPSYVKRIELNLVNVHPNITVHSTWPWSAAIDADNAMGAVAGALAMQEALQRANNFGIGAVTVKHSNHFGAAGYFARMAAEADCIGISLAPASKSLAPFGSKEPLLGTNPIAVGAPAGRNAPWVMDMATSVAARGHIRLAAQQDQPIPAGWALDSEGEPTTDAHAAMSGVMVPFSGPKGSAIAMLVDILGGVLSGSAFAGAIRDMNTDFSAPQNVGHFFMAMKVDAFMPLEQFQARMDEQIQRLHALAPAKGVEQVMYPGEPEARTQEERRRLGVPLNTKVLQSLIEVGQATGVAMPQPINDAMQ